MNPNLDGLFGPSPEMIGRQQYEMMRARAAQEAQMSNIDRANYGMRTAGATLGHVGAGMLGSGNPAIEEAKMREQVMAQGDMDMSSKGLLLKAQQLKDAGNYQDARRFAMAAQVQKEKEDSALLAANKDARQEKHETYLQNQAHELKLLTLQAQRDRDRAASEDRRFSTEERAIASRRADATDRMIAQMQADTRRAATEAKGEQPPKNLTREARLKWEVENGRIDQETYDAAIAASPGAKLQYEKNAAAKSAEIGFKSVEDNIAKLYDPKTKAIKPEANALFGKYDQYRPQIAMSQETVDAANALESLTNQVMMTNLADAKERVGQSFGSMQVQEWEKFTQQLTSLKRGLSPKAAAEAMEYVTNFIATKRSILKAAMGQGSSSAPAAKADPLGLRK